MQLSHPDITRTCNEGEIYESLLALDGASVLELGCGKAEHTRNIARAHPGANIVAAEVDRIQHGQNLALARPANLTFADFGAQAITLPDASIDVVMMFKSLHHVPVQLQDEALREIHRVLKPGGCAYLSEPVFAGELNELMRIFNDEELVRRAAFEAVQRAVENRLFELAAEIFFLAPAHYRDFAEFEKKHFQVTHSERNVSEAQRSAVERLFNTYLGPGGASLTQQIRVDLLRRVA
ncbi:MAG: 2-polyprenyl-3-methyl-5-hydroxy-6-metoxy-1,4-benzoquinol methylase [Betaproteobacteria bacterium RIFCSPLOWO2_02_FULL_65_24]|nr:MAG: 2-polyprenyl-3-methyl-5-hydroxy-6-metoxy-1,4-benzoquinol methylase [Betaproteobacteria bacterium RIFCSPLOWO2_02_FULL_65_24]OGA72662.1 MAG: 2-polyprenyl-3-methyl-5-hydroxy-6-metoxy-1,4-benzoquinol methylase [Betaproteobacteria bacterium RIFCSPLOWO2_12_FULL_66_14]